MERMEKAVCVRERRREREEKRVCVCVRERERESVCVEYGPYGKGVVCV